jgi:thiosulfate/3-mercaptopyruvate sulfurtransferase
MSNRYAHPEVLVETSWTEDHLKDPNVRSAVLFDWKKDINDPLSRNIISKESCEELLKKSGINEDTTLVLYGDFNNWFAAFAFWVFKYYGYQDVRIMNGGRKKWLEEDRPLDKTIPSYPAGNFKASSPDEKIRTYLNHVSESLKNRQSILVDVRSPAEFTGEVTAPAEYPTEHAQRGGHIPAAINIPWGKAVNEDGTFKSPEELMKLYKENGILPEKEVISYCRIGERSSHTWFVLKYLLGYPDVKNYDGSWTEWGNMIGNQIEK